MKTGKIFSVGVALVTAFATTTLAQVWPGESLVFSQQPMVQSNILGQTYFGHDEGSTANYIPGNQDYDVYAGNFMADDFALKSNQSITHVKFWGGYLSNPPSRHVGGFLISFESNVAASASQPFSHPGAPLYSQIGSVFPTLAFGGFTEKLIRPQGASPNQTPLYEYDGELWAPLDLVANTVYWLKIIAITAPGDQWGWHNRDYLTQDVLAPTPPPVTPGENGFFSPIPEVPPIWHFEDDAVGGDVTFTDFRAPGCGCDVTVNQTNMSPKNYMADLDGPSYIGSFSKDLAFEVYGVPYGVPEPSVALIGAGAAALMSLRRAKRPSAM